jgi:hypothetical protein
MHGLAVLMQEMTRAARWRAEAGPLPTSRVSPLLSFSPFFLSCCLNAMPSFPSKSSKLMSKVLKLASEIFYGCYLLTPTRHDSHKSRNHIISRLSLAASAKILSQNHIIISERAHWESLETTRQTFQGTGRSLCRKLFLYMNCIFIIYSTIA